MPVPFPAVLALIFHPAGGGQRLNNLIPQPGFSQRTCFLFEKLYKSVIAKRVILQKKRVRNLQLIYQRQLFFCGFKKNFIYRFAAGLTLPHEIHDIYRFHGISVHFNPPTLRVLCFYDY